MFISEHFGECLDGWVGLLGGLFMIYYQSNKHQPSLALVFILGDNKIRCVRLSGLDVLDRLCKRDTHTNTYTCACVTTPTCTYTYLEGFILIV